jgi:hypothetical protein
MKLPWSTSEYTPLEPTDLDGSAPTPEARIRVAAALATMIRDANIVRGGAPPAGAPNAETVRLFLTMPEAEWQRNASQLKMLLGDYGYDIVSGEERFNQIRGAARR